MKTFLLHSLFILFFSTGMFFSATNMVVAQTPAPAAPVTPASLGAARTAAASALVAGRGVFSVAGDMLNNALSPVVKWIALGLLHLFGWILAMAGGLLNISITYLVIGMGDLIKTGGFGAPIDTMWKIMRDLVNISFVFALIYIGITTIISSGASGAKKFLGAVIISALLVNFSLFFAKATIDVSNIFADNIYSKMLSTPQMASPAYGISGAFVDKLGLAKFFVNPESPGTQRRLQDMMDSANGGVAFTIMYSIGAGILMFVLAFAFAFGAFLLIIRFVMLILLMIFSPVAFLPEILPGLGEYRKKWWSTLISQAFFAPVYLFGLYLSLYILSSSPINLGDDGLAALFTPGLSGVAAGSINILLYYVIAIILIIGTTALAKSMSASGASSFGKLTDWTEKKIKSGLLVPPVSRRVLGFVGGGVGGALRRLDTRPAKTWYGKATQFAAKTAVYGLSGGAMDAQGRRDFEKNLKGVKVGAYSVKDTEDFDKELKKARNTQERADDLGVLLKQFEKDGLATEKLEKAIKGLTVPELEELKSLEKIAGLLSNKQMDQIKDSKEKTEGEKSQLKVARKNMQMKMAGFLPSATDPTKWISDSSTKAKIDKMMQDMKPGDIAKLPKEILITLEALQYITSDVLRKIQDDAELGRAQNDDVKKLRDLILASGDASAQKYLNGNARALGYYGEPQI